MERGRQCERVARAGEEGWAGGAGRPPGGSLLGPPALTNHSFQNLKQNPEKKKKIHWQDQPNTYIGQMWPSCCPLFAPPQEVRRTPPCLLAHYVAASCIKHIGQTGIEQSWSSSSPRQKGQATVGLPERSAGKGRVWVGWARLGESHSRAQRGRWAEGRSLIPQPNVPAPFYKRGSREGKQLVQGDPAAWQGGVAFGMQPEMNRGLAKARSQSVSGVPQGMETNVRKSEGSRDAASPGGKSGASGSLAVFCLLTWCKQHRCSVCENPLRISVLSHFN